MVLYTVKSLVMPDKKAIIGVKVGNTLHTVLDLLCDRNCFEMLVQHTCIETFVHSKMMHAYSEIIFSSSENDITEIEVDISAGAWDPETTEVLVAFLGFTNDGFGSRIPVISSLSEGPNLMDYYSKITHRNDDIILFTSSLVGKRILKGFMHEGKLYNEKDILLDPKCGSILRNSLSAFEGYIGSSLQGITANVIVPDNCKLMQIDIDSYPLTDILTELNSAFSSGFSPSVCIDDNNSFVRFDDYYGNASDIGAYQATYQDVIYLIEKENKRYIYAAKIKSTLVSLKDIVRIPATYEAVASALNIEAIPVEFYENNTLDLVVDDIVYDHASVVFKSYKLFENANTVQAQNIVSDYEAISKGGLIYPEVTSKITLPSTGDFTLAHFTNPRGNGESIDAYIKAYATLYPNMSNLKQEKPTDKIEFALPTYKQLQGIYSKDENLKENNDTEAASETYFFNQGSENITFSSYSQLDIPIDIEHIKLGMVFEFYDTMYFKEALNVTKSNVDPMLVEGNPNNNTLGIMSNEISLYLGLRNLVIDGICIEHNIYTLDDLNVALSEGKRSTIVDEFISNLADDAFALNWKHTGHVFNTVTSEDEEDSESLSTAMPGRYHVKMIRDSSGHTRFVKEEDQNTEMTFLQDGLPKIDAYIKNCVVNPFAWVEVVIRLLRWGARKPNALYAPTLVGKAQFLNMNTLVMSDFSGNYAELEHNTYEDGCFYTVAGSIQLPVTDDVDITELNQHCNSEIQRDSTIPFGITLAATFKDSNISEYRFIDIFTAATQIASGSLKVLGVHYNPETKTFTCDTEETSIWVANDEDVLDSAEYTPEDYFHDTLTVTEAVDATNRDSNKYQVSKCDFLLKYLFTISCQLKLFDLNALSILKILHMCETRIDWNCIAGCEQLLENMDSETRANRVDEIRNTFNVDKSVILQCIFFRKTIEPFLALSLTNTISLADQLTAALKVLDNLNNRVSSARKVAVASGSEIAQAISKCTKCIQFNSLLDNTPICYVGEVPGESRPVLWLPQEAKPAAGTSITIQNTTHFLNKVASEAVMQLRALKSSNNTAAAQEVFYKEIRKLFIISNPKIMLTLIPTCAKINKEWRLKLNESNN